MPTDSKEYDVTIDSENGYVYFDPKGKHEYTIILLHGLGGTPDLFFNMFVKDV